MTALTLIKVNDAQARQVLANMSPEDVAETKAAGLDVEQAFLSGLPQSVISGIVVKDGAEPVALFGCVPDLRQLSTGIPWMVVTPEFRKHPRDAMALSRKVLAQMHKKFANLHNLVHAEHLTAIGWLSWLGYTVEIDTPQGPNNAFFYFHRSR